MMSVSFEEALLSILALAHEPDERNILLPDALSEVTSKDVVADRNIPPFNRSAMDGYAVRWTGNEEARAFGIIGTLNPGGTWSGDAGEADCIKIMTGARVPAAFDTVIPVEHAEETTDGKVLFLEKAIAGQHIAWEGEDAKQGDILVPRGTILRTRHIASLAAVGKWEVTVYSRPSISVLATGGELMEPWERASGAFIRNSNAHFLLSSLKKTGFTQVEYLGIAKDNREEITTKIRAGLSSDLLLITGGVSEGDIDIVPDCLRACGVEKAVHKIAVKPGKPIYAGRSENGGVVIALPGSPVAVMVHFQMVVLPFLRKTSGAADFLPRPVWLPLAADAKNKGERKKFALGKIETVGSSSRVVEIPSRGSGDFVSASRADGVIEIPMGARLLPAGTHVRFYPVF